MRLLFSLDVIMFFVIVCPVHSVEDSITEVKWTFDNQLMKQNIFKTTLPTKYQCMKLCLVHKLCRGLSFDGDICALNSEDAENHKEWLSNPDAVLITRSNIPQEMADGCIGHSCNIDEMCVEVGSAYVCVKHQYSIVRCPEGWGRQDDLCFRLFRDLLPFKEAKDFCAKTGAELFTLETEEEFEHNTKWMNFQLHRNTTNRLSGKIWIGLPSPPPAWLNMSSAGDTGSDMCIGLTYYSLTGFINNTDVAYWESVHCSNKYDFICQQRAPAYWP